MNSILITLVLSCILVSGIFFINNNNNHDIVINAKAQDEYYNEYNEYYYYDYGNRYNYLPQEEEHHNYNDYYNDYIFKTGDSQEPEFISIQNAQSGSISEISTNTYLLKLNDVSDKTILFSDRPDRIVKSVSTENFVDTWNIGADSFTLDPPNAVLIVDELEEQQDIAILELFNPVYDEDKKILSYEITPDGETSVELDDEFGQSTMVIDARLDGLILN